MWHNDGPVSTSHIQYVCVRLRGDLSCFTSFSTRVKASTGKLVLRGSVGEVWFLRVLKCAIRSTAGEKTVAIIDVWRLL